jgi:tripartite ATP-independent transporter DctM subunit
MVALIFVSLGVLLAIGVPIAFALCLTTLFYLIVKNDAAFFPMLAQQLYEGMDLYLLLAIPFFIFAGEIMRSSGITKNLVRFSNSLVGHFRGGLAYVNIVASIFFSGVTGSAVADTSAIGTVMIPSMEEDGYDLDFSAAVTAASSVIGPIIPPSILMIIYSAVMDTSVAAMFAAGFLPGILVGLSLCVLSYYYSKKRNYPKRDKRVSLREFLSSFLGAIVPLIMPVIILGGILSGIFTPTEAAAVAVFYGLAVGFLTKGLKWHMIPKLMLNTVLVSSTILFVIASAKTIGWLFVIEQIPQTFANLFVAITENRYIFLLIVNILLFIVGMIMDPAVSILILGPILAPAAINMGVHPLHFALIMCINLTIGLATPPLGFILYVTCGITDLSVERLTKAIFPFILAEAIVVFLVTYIPFIPLWIPKLLGYI